MQLECLIKRDGVTEFHFDGMRYQFQPNPFGENGQAVTGIATITNVEHLKYFLARPHIREYQRERTMKETMEDALAGKKNALAGVEFRKFRDAGYIIIDKKRRRFAGADGEWKGNADGMTPFVSEISAYEWLRDAVANGDFEEPENYDDPVEKRPKSLTKSAKDSAAKAPMEV
jgi:hypothetical protein